MSPRPNIVFERMPSAYEAGGVRYEADTSHRCGVRCALLLEDPAVDERLKPVLLARNVLDPAIRSHALPERALTKDAVEWCLWFHMCGEEPDGRRRGRRAARSFSFDDDADRIVADFQAVYGIDLTDPAVEVHWWRFMALLRALDGDTAVGTAIRIRRAEPEKGMTDKQRRALREAKEAVRLTPRTLDEAKAAADAAWGVG